MHREEEEEEDDDHHHLEWFVISWIALTEALPSWTLLTFFLGDFRGAEKGNNKAANKQQSVANK